MTAYRSQTNRTWPPSTSDYAANPQLAVGDVYYNTSSTRLRVCTSLSPVTWVDVGGSSAIDLPFHDSVTGTTAVVVGSVYIPAAATLTTSSRAMIGTQAGGTATARLRRFSTGLLVTNATWAFTGTGMSAQAMALAASIPAADWYDIELLGDAALTVALLTGLHLEF